MLHYGKELQADTEASPGQIPLEISRMCSKSRNLADKETKKIILKEEKDMEATVYELNHA